MRKRRVLSVEVPDNLLLGILDYLDNQDLVYTSMAGAVALFIKNQIDLMRSAGALPFYEAESPEELEHLLLKKVQLAGQLKSRRKLAGEQASRPMIGSSNRGLSALREAVAATVTNSDFAPPITNDYNFQQKLETNDELEKILESAKNLPVEELYPSANPAANLFGFDDLDAILQLAAAETALEDEIELLSKITVGTVSIPDGDLNKKKTPDMISLLDPRLQKDKIWKRFDASEDEAGKLAIRIIYFHLPPEHWGTEKAEDLLKQFLTAAG